MAKDFNAIVVGFNVNIEKQAESIAIAQSIFYRTYTIIYKMLEEIEDAAQMLLEKAMRKIAGKGKIIASFEGTKGTIIGLKIEEGRVQVGDYIQKEEVEENIGKVISIKQNKEDVKQVGKDKECGIMSDVKIDFTIGDMLIFLSSKK
jgi:translation initiation factor IF-2